MRDPRRDYIRLLQRSVDNFTPAPSEERDATLIGESAEAGYVKGKAMSDASGVTRGAVSWGVTVEGRLFLRRFEKKIRKESLWSRAKRWGVPVLAYVASVATPVLSDWLKMLFHVKS
jgi:hypothetical protein